MRVKKKPVMSAFDFVETDDEEEPMERKPRIKMTKTPSTDDLRGTGLSKKMKKNPLQFPQITCPNNIKDDLSVSEIQILKQYTNLALEIGRAHV